MIRAGNSIRTGIMRYEFNLLSGLHLYDGKGKWGGLDIKREEDDELPVILRNSL
jgi:hypothetical protein